MASNLRSQLAADEVVEVRADSSKIKPAVYVQLEVPGNCSKVKMILFECESLGQGFADYKNYSYSWRDLVVKSRRGEEVYRENRVYENAVANSSYQMHVKHYSEDDEIVQKCKPGNTLELVLNARYRNWANYAKYGRIAVYIE